MRLLAFEFHSMWYFVITELIYTDVVKISLFVFLNWIGFETTGLIWKNPFSLEFYIINDDIAYEYLKKS